MQGLMTKITNTNSSLHKGTECTLWRDEKLFMVERISIRRQKCLGTSISYSKLQNHPQH